MGNLRQLFDVDNVELWIADRLGVDGPCLVVDRGAQARFIFSVDKFYRDAKLWQRIVEEVVGTAIERW